MPLIVWRNKETGDEIEVLRSRADATQPPTPDEGAYGPPENWESGVWLNSRIGLKRTGAWGRGKGEWGSDQKVRNVTIKRDGTTTPPR